MELKRSGSRAELVVTDSGVGMNEVQASRCFDLYYSTKRGGTGLGLATVKRIVDMHGGEIAVISEEGRGTRFHIWLPLLQEIPVGDRMPENREGSGSAEDPASPGAAGSAESST